MAQTLLNFIIDLFFWIIGLIGSILIYPIQVLLVTLFPDISTFISSTLGFFGNNVASMISFVKEIILEISCLPRELYLVLIIFIFARFSISPTIRVTKMILNLFKLLRGGKTE